MTEHFDDELEGTEVALLEHYEGAEGPTREQEDRMLARLRDLVGDPDGERADGEDEGSVELSGRELALLEAYRDASGPTPHQVERMFAAVDAAATDPEETDSIRTRGRGRVGPMGAAVMTALAFAAGVALTLQLRPAAGGTAQERPMAWTANAAADQAIRAEGLVPQLCVPETIHEVEEVLVPVNVGADGVYDPPLGSRDREREPLTLEDVVDADADGEGPLHSTGGGGDGEHGFGVLATVPGQANAGTKTVVGGGTRRSPGGRGVNGAGRGQAGDGSRDSAGDVDTPAPVDEEGGEQEGEEPEEDEEGEPEEGAACEGEHFACTESAMENCEVNPEGCDYYFQFCDMNLDSCLGNEPQPPHEEPEPPDDEEHEEMCEEHLSNCLIEAEIVCQQEPANCENFYWECEFVYADCMGYDPPEEPEFP